MSAAGAVVVLVVGAVAGAAVGRNGLSEGIAATTTTGDNSGDGDVAVASDTCAFACSTAGAKR